MKTDLQPEPAPFFAHFGRAVILLLYNPKLVAMAMTVWVLEMALAMMPVPAFLSGFPLTGFPHAIAAGAILHGLSEAGRREPVSFMNSIWFGIVNFGRLFITSAIAQIGILVGILVFIIPGVALFSRWALALPVVVFDGNVGFSALKRSTQLTEGIRGRILVVLGLCELVWGIGIGALLAILLSASQSSDWASVLLVTVGVSALDAIWRSAVIVAVTFDMYRYARDRELAANVTPDVFPLPTLDH